MIAVQVRFRVHVYGAVQGVGFRPFVYRLAKELGLAGTVMNSTSGAFVEVEGPESDCLAFLEQMRADCPRPAWIAGFEVSTLEPVGLTDFQIAESDDDGICTATVLPDLATCPECLSELFDPRDRRYGYPFVNCTHCGPRFTIVEGIPYDRCNTTMRGFVMCKSCAAEYGSPEDRRFHAQPNACPVCGPHLSEPLEAAVRLLREGSIVALKGIGGFQLLVDARNDEAVRRLRGRKLREQKPFAVMFPDVKSVLDYCRADDAEIRSLTSAAAPIVLLERRTGSVLSPSVSAGSPWIGAMLPYSPLHHLLLRSFAGPVVATSGNRSEEPIATTNEEATERLAGIADGFVLHNRPIARHADDSVVRISGGQEVVLRRARGYAPMPVRVPRSLPRVLALGAHLKSAVAIGSGQQIVLSQHIGDLDSPESRDAFVRTLNDLRSLYRFTPDVVACDLHPDYFSSIFAETLGCPVIRVQHHQAHVAACAAENDIDGDYLGVAWDGTGYGPDGTIWGGEFLACTGGTFERIAHLRPFRLPGGDTAIRDCRRSAASVLFECGLPVEDRRLASLLESASHSPVTTSAGRLFDGVAAITGVASTNAYEGQAAMFLEAAAASAGASGVSYELPFEGGQLDWRPMIAAIAGDARTRTPEEIARGFHDALARAIVRVATAYGFKRVVLSGGVFQNVLLVNLVRSMMDVKTHCRIPPNDGGIAAGQVVIAGYVCA